MKPNRYILGFGLASLLYSMHGAIAKTALPHLDLEMTSREYQPLLADLLAKRNLLAEEDVEPSRLLPILDIGRRNLEWLDHINSLRSAAQQLELSTPDTQIGYPIDQPTFNSETLVLQKYNAWLAATPTSISQVLTTEVAYPDAPPVDDVTFLTTIRMIDRIYQSASRWLLQQPYLEEYKAGQKGDIRGYYFLQQENGLENLLETWHELSDADKSRLSPWLIGQCFNSMETTLASCGQELEEAAAHCMVLAYFRKYLPMARELYESYFTIPTSRSDVTWTEAAPAQFVIPFRDPQNAEVTAWLRDNIEDEFKWQGWQLRLNFVATEDENTTHIDFVEGTTPHVNELAGSIITMDANRSLSEYSSRWTIRHEYGHVLGLPDCYVEFYDVTAEVMVNYQLDVENLMCSRRGRFQQRHFDELQRVYFNITTNTAGAK